MTKKHFLFLSLLAALLFTSQGANAQLAGGTYTINSAQATGGTNFTSFADAVTALSAGVSGAVVLNVAAGSGPYTEQVILPVIPGASASNTVTFNGNSNALTYASSNTNERATLKLNGANYVTVNNLNINATGASYGYCVQLTNNADHNTINNCTLTPSASTLNYCGLCMNGGGSAFSYLNNSFSDSNTISNNTVNGGYYSITVIGDPASRIYGNKVINNTLLNSYFTGIYAVGNSNLLIEGNDISRATLASLNSFYGINLGNGNQNTLVSKNKIHNFFGSLSGTSPYSAYGLATQSVATAGNENIFSNNLVYDMNGDGTQYGMYNTGASYTFYYYNTISSDNQNSVSGNTYGFYQTTAASNIVLKNNLISITRTGTGNKYAMYMNAATTTYTSNYNNYYINSTAGTNYIGRIGTTNYSALTAWQAANAQDIATVTIAPLFTNPSSGNFTPNSSLIDNLGIPINNISTDITGATRNATTPDMGAYEFSAPVISVTGSNQLCTGTTSALTGTPSGGTWTSSNTAVATISSTGIVTAVTAGTSVITYTTSTGYKTDTVTVTATPVVDTISGLPSTMCVGNIANLTDATAGGTWTSSNQFMATITASGTLTAVGPGSLTVTYTAANGACTATTTKSTTIYTIPNANITPQGSLVACTGDILLLNANTGNYSYQWLLNNSPISNATSNSYIATTAGTYSVVESTGGGCADTASVLFTINPVPTPTINPAGTAAFCNGDSVLLTAGNGTTNYTYQWRRNGSNIPGATNATYTAHVDGYYAVLAAALGCSGLSAGVAVQNNTPANTLLASGPLKFCQGGSVTLQADTGTGYNYQWQRNGTTITTATGNSYLAQVSGTYHVTVTNGACSTTTADSTVTVNPLPVPVITLNGTTYSTGTFAGYQWQLNGNDISGATNQTYNATQAGTYSVIVTDVNGCTGSATYSAVGVATVTGNTQILVYPNPVIDRIVIDAPAGATAIITTIDGKILIRASTDNTIMADNIAPGVYLLYIRDKNNTLLTTRKLVKI